VQNDGVMMYTTPPGWYPDPTRPSQLRFWNGAAWTEHVAADPHAQTAAAATPNQTFNTSVSKTKVVAILAMGLGTLVLTIALGVFYTNNGRTTQQSAEQIVSQLSQCQKDARDVNVFMTVYRAYYGRWPQSLSQMLDVLKVSQDTPAAISTTFDRVIAYPGARYDAAKHTYSNNECGDGY